MKDLLNLMSDRLFHSKSKDTKTTETSNKELESNNLNIPLLYLEPAPIIDLTQNEVSTISKIVDTFSNYLQDKEDKYNNEVKLS